MCRPGVLSVPSLSFASRRSTVLARLFGHEFDLRQSTAKLEPALNLQTHSHHVVKLQRDGSPLGVLAKLREAVLDRAFLVRTAYCDDSEGPHRAIVVRGIMP